MNQRIEMITALLDEKRLLILRTLIYPKPPIW